MTQDTGSSAATEKQRTAEEQHLIKMLEELKGRSMTEQEKNLAIDQARAIGEL